MPTALLSHAWFPPSPGVVLLVLIGLSALAALIERSGRRRHKRALRQLAARWQMTYSPHDRLRVAAKVANRLPIPGAADVYVTDVIYGGQGERYRFVFTAEYTVGVVRGKRRRVRVGTFSESRGRESGQRMSEVLLAPEGLPLLEQYEKLTPKTEGAAAVGAS